MIVPMVGIISPESNRCSFKKTSISIEMLCHSSTTILFHQPLGSRNRTGNSPINEVNLISHLIRYMIGAKVFSILEINFTLILKENFFRSVIRKHIVGDSHLNPPGVICNTNISSQSWFC